MWKIEDLTPGTLHKDRIVTYAYPSMDLAAQFGIRVKILTEEDLNEWHDGIVKFCEIMKARPWPFTMVLHSKNVIEDIDAFRENATHDIKEHLEALKQNKDYEITGDMLGKVSVTTEKMLDIHQDLDQYPFYEVADKIKRGEL